MNEAGCPARAEHPAASDVRILGRAVGVAGGVEQFGQVVGFGVAPVDPPGGGCRPDAVTFMDSTGIDTLLRAHHALVAQGGRLALVGALPPVLRVMDLTGVDEVIPLYPTVSQALHP